MLFDLGASPCGIRIGVGVGWTLVADSRSGRGGLRCDEKRASACVMHPETLFWISRDSTAVDFTLSCRSGNDGWDCLSCIIYLYPDSPSARPAG
jgi:hypothetical protein